MTDYSVLITMIIIAVAVLAVGVFAVLFIKSVFKLIFRIITRRVVVYKPKHSQRRK